jgi:hypothetical protein
MHRQARGALKNHNRLSHPGRDVPETLARRDGGLVDWL